MKKIYLFIILFFINVHQNDAATKVWSYTGATGAWATGSNWAGGIAPVAGDDVTIGSKSTTTINNVPSISLNSLSVGSSSSVTLSSSGPVMLTITTLTLTSNLTTGSSVNLALTGGNINSGKTLSIGSSRTLTIAGTLTVAGSISNLGTITVNGLLNFTGIVVSAPGNCSVSVGGEIRFSGSGSVTGLGGTSIISGLLTLAGTTGTASGFLAQWAQGSTIQYTGTFQQTMNYYEFPSTGPTNVIINNPAGVKFNTSIPPNPVIPGTLTLSSGVLYMGSTGSYPTLTFHTGNVPILKGGGSIDPGSPTTSTIIFGTSSNTGGNAFTLPDNLFIHTDIYRLTVNRTNPLTLNNQSITVTTFCNLNLGQVILGAGNLNVNASSVATTGGFGTNTMFVTSSSSGLLTHLFDTSASAVIFRYPIGEIATLAMYDGFVFSMNSNESASKQVGFKVVDDICNPYIGSATDYTTRYYSTSLTGTGNYNYSVTLPYLSLPSSDCSGGGGDVIGAESNMTTAYYNGGWKQAGTVLNGDLIISNVTQTVAPLGYDIMGINGASPLAVKAFSIPGIIIYPNPATNKLKINTSTTLSGTNEELKIKEISIYNTLGVLVRHRLIILSGEVDISSLSPGIYFAEFPGDVYPQIEKFVKE